MSNQTYGMLIGGLLPALCFALSNVFSKPANTSGLGLGIYIVVIGLSVTLAGAVIYLVHPQPTYSVRGLLFASGVGFAWACGAAGVGYALTHYEMTLSRLVPLFNMNTLFSVLIGLWVFAEWKDVQALKLLAGAALIVLGGSLVATA